MAIYNATNLSGGVDSALIDVARNVPTFIPMFLVFIFIVIFMGGSSAQKRRTGYSDMPMWATISSLAVFMMSLILGLKDGLMSLGTLGIVIGITLISGVWLFLDRRSSEI